MGMRPSNLVDHDVIKHYRSVRNDRKGQGYKAASHSVTVYCTQSLALTLPRPFQRCPSNVVCVWPLPRARPPFTFCACVGWRHNVGVPPGSSIGQDAGGFARVQVLQRDPVHRCHAVGAQRVHAAEGSHQSRRRGQGTLHSYRWRPVNHAQRVPCIQEPWRGLTMVLRELPQHARPEERRQRTDTAGASMSQAKRAASKHTV
mmetsp:Transcript_12937/g.34489  ORF Transcript_12937/g.34489 Transcript_12937/m.34489 type:complete len:202 (+) Transcript_12937:597-1202(+)